MNKENIKKSNEKNSLIGKVLFDNSNLDFSNFNKKKAHILSSVQLELESIASYFLSKNSSFFERIVVNTFLFGLEFEKNNGSVILLIHHPLPLPTIARKMILIDNTKMSSFIHREDLGLIYHDFKIMCEDDERRKNKLRVNILEDLEILPETLNEIFELAMLVRSLILAISSAIVINNSPDSIIHNMALYHPTGIITDFNYIYTKNILVAFLSSIFYGKKQIPFTSFTLQVLNQNKIIKNV
jgi:hypothetical protein